MNNSYFVNKIIIFNSLRSINRKIISKIIYLYKVLNRISNGNIW